MSLSSYFFEFAADALCIFDASGQCCAVNPAFEKVLGYSLDEMRSRKLHTLAHAESAAATQRAIAELSSQQPTATFNGRYQCKSGEWRWLEWTASIASGSTSGQCIYCVARDVTTRVQVHAQSQAHIDRQMQKAQADVLMYADIVKNMQVGLYVWQLEKADEPHRLRLIATNPAANEFTGIASTAEIVGKTIAEAFPALMETDIPQRYAQVALSGQGQDLGEVPYEDSRVEQGVFAVKAFPLPGRCVGVTFENITERKETYWMLNQRKNELVTVNLMLTNALETLEQRNQELDQFAYVASHDLRAPLRAIANLASWIEEDLGSRFSAENKEQFELLKNRVYRMEGLINGLLEYSRIGRTHQSHEQINTAELIEDIVDSISPLGEFTIKVVSAMPVLEATKVPLMQVFSNLIVNAVKHHDRPDGTVQISAREVDDFYEFSVADDGPGIDPAYHEKIFTIFQTLKSRDELESTGIGLSLVKKIVSAEGGQIVIDSSLGQGATFRFTWPKAPNQGIHIQASGT